MSKNIELECPICNIKFNRYLCHIRSEIVCCSKKCLSIHLKNSIHGNNNPNFGNNWTEEQKNKQSNLIKSKIDDEFRLKAGSANKGKKFSPERIKKCHEHRSKESYSRPCSEKSKKIIGQKSKAKWSEEYKIKHRKTMEGLGYWIPLKDKNDFEIYFQNSDWVEKMFDLIKEEKQLELLKKNGIFHYKNNKNGVVRDHMLSRRSGFILGLFPELLRHPANCQIIPFIDNVKKRKSRYIDGDSITIDELFEKIISYKDDWKEQNLCIKLISEYKLGKRYERKT